MVDRAWWAEDSEALFARLKSGPEGLPQDEAERRVPARRKTAEGNNALHLFAGQFTNPLVLILAFGALLSLVLREWVDASIILAIVAGSGVLGFVQEYRASQAVAELRSRLARQVRVIRDGTEVTLRFDRVAPGDVAVLKAGDLVPGDGAVLQSDGLTVDEAVLTGEAFPVDKMPGPSALDTPLSQRRGALFEGTSIRSGTGRMLVVAVGETTQFGAISAELEKAEEATEFARGMARFGAMLMRVMLAVVALVLTVSLLLGRELMNALLFAMALAVAISPQLLPAIVSVTLATGARRMTQGGVLVRRLQAIENLGGMDVLCTDKTGTLTSGAIALSAAVDIAGQASPGVLRLAAINARLQTAMASPLDEAILGAASASGLDLAQVEKRRDFPYDFKRRRYTVEAGIPGAPPVLITKGAVAEVLSDCTTARVEGKAGPADAALEAQVQDFVRDRADNGFRVLAVATGEPGVACLEGFLLFFDPLKPGIRATIDTMRDRGISVRIISGDNRHVCAHIAAEIGLPQGDLLSGDMIAALDDATLAARITGTTVFAEVEPQQKERIVRAFQHAGHAVGYMGDGINDAPALRAADVGISVDSAVDVARESADIVLLQRDLGVITRGVEDGRRTFANTLKYVAITISANFGNMVSMALATVLLPFLPLLPVQILLNNFLSDFPAITIASDTVDSERLATAQRWDIARVRNFMILFGLVSTVFDLASFAILHFVVHADAATFRTGWFVVSLLTELAALFVLRTQRPFWRSPPSALLLWSSVLVALVAVCLPYSGPIAQLFEFRALGPGLLAMLFGLVFVYALGTETAKRYRSLADA